MTQLYLNGYRAVLKDDTSFKLIFENPYFTKSSVYTHDITLPLKGCNENIKIFGHLYLDYVKKDIQPLSAILIIGGKCILSGSAIVLGIDDKDVKIQLISGNSEFNYFFKKEIYIDELDLGVAESIPTADAELCDFSDLYFRSKWWGSYPDRKYCYYPVRNGDGVLLNRLLASMVDDKPLKYYYRFSKSTYLREAPPFSVQPFLCFIIQLIVEKLGYKLVENQIENTFLKDIIICHGVNTLNFAECLPHWSVIEFFEELEKLFAVTTVVDERSKEIRIVFLKNYFSQNDYEVLTDIVDEYEVKMDNDDVVDITSGNIGYGISSDFYKYRKFPESIRKAASLKKYDSKSELDSDYNNMNEIDKRKTIFECENVRYIHYVSNNQSSLKVVDQFRDLVRNQENPFELDIEFKIIPSDFSIENYEQWYFTDNTGTGPYIVLLAKEDKSVIKNEYSIQADLDSNVDYTKNNRTKMQIALSNGVFHNLTYINKYSNKPITMAYPWPFIDGQDWMIDGQYDLKGSLQLIDQENIDSLGSVCYRSLDGIKTDKEYNFYFISRKYHDTSKIFLIHNKRYVCNSIEVDANVDGINILKLGKFYPLE